MKEIKVLGAGCSKCKAVLRVVQEAAENAGFTGTVEKIEDMAEIISYGVISTPAVIIDGKIVFAGGVPNREQARLWFQSDCCSYV